MAAGPRYAAAAEAAVFLAAECEEERPALPMVVPRWRRRLALGGGGLLFLAAVLAVAALSDSSPAPAGDSAGWVDAVQGLFGMPGAQPAWQHPAAPKKKQQQHGPVAATPALLARMRHSLATGMLRKQQVALFKSPRVVKGLMNKAPLPVKRLVAHFAQLVKNKRMVDHAKERYSHQAATAFAALAKLSYCGPLPGLFASAALTCMPANPLKIPSPCQDADFHVVPGTVRMLLGHEVEEPEALFGYAARLAPTSNASSVEPGVVLVVRGSVSNRATRIRDHMNQLVGDIDGCKNCKVHAGYRRSASGLGRQVERYMQELWCYPAPKSKADQQKADSLGHQACTVYVTGHGSGGALAALLAWELKSRGYRVGPSYVFEATQVGNRPWAQAALEKFSGMPHQDGPIFAVTHAQDLAPRWPQKPDYAPWGFEVHYAEGKEGAKHAQVCLPGPGCGIGRYPMANLTSKGLCKCPLAPDGDFCSMGSGFAAQCYGGLSSPLAMLVQSMAPPKSPAAMPQPRESAAASWFA